MSPNRPAAASGSAFEASDAEADASHHPSSPSPSKTPPPDPNPKATTPPAPAPAAEDSAAAGSDSGAAYDSDADHRPAPPKPAASPSRRTARRGPKPRSRSPTPEANSDSNGSAAPAGDGAYSEYGNASPLPPPRPSRPEAAAVKPLSSRPMDPPRRSVPSFSEPRPKRPRSAAAPAVMEQLKRPSSRLWSPGDEVVILRGLTAYRAKRGVLPSSMHDISKFYGHISNELSVKVTTTQLSDKVRRLKQKYHQLATRAKNGRDPDFPIPQDHNIYDLGKKVWGPNAVAGGGSSIVEYEDSGSGDSDEEMQSGESDGDMESGRDDRDRKKKRLKPITLANGGGSRLGTMATGDCSREKVEFEKAKDAYPYLWETVEDLSRQQPNGLAFKKGFEMIEGPKARGMEEKLRKFRVTEVRHQLRRMELMNETVKMVLDALGG